MDIKNSFTYEEVAVLRLFVDFIRNFDPEKISKLPSESPPPAKPPGTLTHQELAERLRIDEKTLHRWTGPKAKHSPLPFKPKKIGRRKFYDIEEVEKFLASI